MGNHDILHQSHYEAARVECIDEGTMLHGLTLFHHPPDIAKTQAGPHVCGHIHPGIALSSKSRDRMILPCFYLKGHQLILPAFGALTGLARCSKEQEQERLIGISGASLLEL
jgi:metallophosphoesterase superfamily enzyme